VILLAFFFPLALYLLLLGLINRRRYPLLVPGVWDGIGLLFGASGFLLFAGPAVLSGLSERWRVYWLLGKGAPLGGPDGFGQLWIFLSVLYFVLIVGGAAYYLRRQRRLTAIYNAEAAQVEYALAHCCAELGLSPVRSGDLFLFGFSPDGKPTEESAILELDSFPLMRHVTLRWDPSDSPLRPTLERQLAQQLAQTPTDYHLLGGWLLTFGFILFAFEVVGSLLVILVALR
jgi:hypothetical protein